MTLNCIRWWWFLRGDVEILEESDSSLIRCPGRTSRQSVVTVFPRPACRFMDGGLMNIHRCGWGGCGGFM
uniref:Uncharacterized protein n=1 Tax=Knipowitschia caucasica TaxID=637954 RepID=A0AAV2MND5_KNICA